MIPITSLFQDNARTVIAVVLALGLVASGLPASPAAADEGTDTEPPSAVEDLTLETEEHNLGYVNEVPNWTWDPARDDTGIDHYDVRENGPDGEEQIFEVDPLALSYEPRDARDGHYCIEVRAVDPAGNEGPWTDTNCAFLDRIEPEHVLDQPRPATLHLEGPQVLDVHPMPTVPSDRAYVLGGVDVYLNSTDPGDRPSGLHEAVIEESPACSDPRLCTDGLRHSCENIGEPAVCLWEDAEEDSHDPRVRDLTGITWDRANNVVREATVTYTKVDVAVVEQETPDGTAGVVHWESSDTPAFDRYEVYAVVSSVVEDSDRVPPPLVDPRPVQPARQVAVVEQREQLRAVDPVPEPGELWTYVVAEYVEGPGGGPLLHDVTHPTELAYAADDGRVSRPVSCVVNLPCQTG